MVEFQPMLQAAVSDEYQAVVLLASSPWEQEFQVAVVAVRHMLE